MLAYIGILLGVSGGTIALALKNALQNFQDGNWFWGVVCIIIAVGAIWAWIHNEIEESRSSKLLSSSVSTASSTSTATPKANAGKSKSDTSKIEKADTVKVDNSDKTIVGEVVAESVAKKKLPEGCLKVGTSLMAGRYLIKDFISNGGFGNTYLGFDTVMKRDVAIKELFKRDICSRNKQTNRVTVTINSNKPQFDDHKSKFIKEAKRLMSLSHGNIVKVYNVFEENQTAYYVMDYIEGKSLRECIKQRGALSESQVFAFLPGLLSALKKVHGENIWHLDIKPANIILRKDNTPVLIDFGASKQYKDKDGHTVSTSSVIASTPGYAPMEQLNVRDKSNIGPWSDVYALGATLYAILEGVAPPDSSDVLNYGIDFPKWISEKTRKNITRMMEPKLKERPQSVDEVARMFNISLN